MDDILKLLNARLIEYRAQVDQNRNNWNAALGAVQAIESLIAELVSKRPPQIAQTDEAPSQD